MATNGLSQTKVASERADELCQTLITQPTTELIEEGAKLLGQLRDLREFDRLCDLAELVCRLDSMNGKARRLYAQGLIETGKLKAAVGLLECAKLDFDEQHPEYSEFEGLLGRAYKQLFMDTVDPEGIWAETFLKLSFSFYEAAYTRDPVKNFWHDINLAGLAQAAQIRGMAFDCDKPQTYAKAVLENLGPEDPTNQWWYATKAEAHLALDEWADAEQAIRKYIEHKDTTPFALASTLRQLRDFWGIQRKPEGARLLQMLEATLMSRPTPGAVLQIGAQQLQWVAGREGFETIEWYRAGLKCAASVAAITKRLGLRFGTGFAVRAGDFGIEPDDEVLLLTNFHVLNSDGLAGRRKFDNVEIVFEAVGDKPLRMLIRAIVAESGSDRGLDYALFRLNGPTETIKPLDLQREIAKADSKAWVYVIGYPLADVMQFSLRNNTLLDHECEPTGKPPEPTRRRIQYSASTEEGSSGSPVFDDKWECIGLHHAGSKHSRGDVLLQKLNGGNQCGEANQAIWIGSIQDDVKNKKIILE